MKSTPRPRELARALVAGEIPPDSIPEKFAAVVRSHIEATALHLGDRVARAGNREARQAALQSTPATIRDQVEQEARRIFTTAREQRRSNAPS